LLDARDYILRQLDGVRERSTAALASGSASSFDDYRHQVGLIAGLELARELIVDGFRNYDLEDEDDDPGL